MRRKRFRSYHSGLKLQRDARYSTVGQWLAASLSLAQLSGRVQTGGQRPSLRDAKPSRPQARGCARRRAAPATRTRPGRTLGRPRGPAAPPTAHLVRAERIDHHHSGDCGAMITELPPTIF